jgi:tetratricopeptide (TPR) repeat protein
VHEFVARALYEKGKVLDKFGKSKEAEKAFEASIEWYTDFLSSNEDSILYNELLCRRGFAYLQSKNLDKAEKDFRDVLKTNLSEVNAHRGLASIYREKEKYDEAFEEIDKAIYYIEKERIKDPRPYKIKGDIFNFKKEYEEALEWYEKSLDIDPKYVDAWINKATALIKQEKYSKAIKAIEYALYLDEDDKIGWHNKGFIFYQLGQFNRSLEARGKAIELDPNDPRLLTGRAAVYFMLENYNFSLDDLEKALQFDPRNEEIWVSKSKVFYSLFRYSDSLDACESALKISPNNDRILNLKGFYLYKLERHFEAIKAFEKASEKNKKNYRPYMNLGIIYRDKFRNFKKAEPYFEKAITILLEKIFPEDGILIKENASILRKLKKYGDILEKEIFTENITPKKKNNSNFYRITKRNISDAVKKTYFEKPLNKILGTLKKDLLLIKGDIETSKKYSNKWTYIGYILRKLRKYEHALEATEKAIWIYPRNYKAWGNKGLSLKGLGKYDEALESFEISINISPEYVESHINKGLILDQQLLKIDKSVKAFKKAIDILNVNLLANRNAPDIWYHLGLVFYDLEEFEKAIKAFDKVIEINPESIARPMPGEALRAG